MARTDSGLGPDTGRLRDWWLRLRAWVILSALPAVSGVPTALSSLSVGSPVGWSLSAAPPYAVPDPGAGSPPPGTEGLNTILGWGAWGVSFACVGGLLAVAATMALRHRRGEGGETMGSLGWVLGACVLGSAAGPIAKALIV